LVKRCKTIDYGGSTYEEVYWPAEWGPQPPTLPEMAVRAQELAGEAPPLIPVYLDHYLVGAPCQVGNPVVAFSPRSSDVLAMAPDLRTFLIYQFAHLLGVEQADTWKEARDWHTLIRASSTRFPAIPYWGGLYTM
jgi:hypothetical protein